MLVSVLCFGLLSLACQARERALRPNSEDKLLEEQEFFAKARELHERIISIDSHSFVPADSCGATDFLVDLPKMRAGGLDAAKTYQSLGAAYIGLTHARHNDIADSATPIDELGDLVSEHDGLSKFGEQVIAEMNRLGMIIDVSHMSKDGTLDAIRLSGAPVIASHSSIHTIVRNVRNMDDETLRALAAKGGVIQIAAVHSFIKMDPPGAVEAFSALLEEFDLETDADAKMLPPQRRTEFESRLANLGKHWALATVAHMADHIDYAVGLVGLDHVGIGSDFEGCGGLIGWADASETLNVIAELLRRGYSDDEIEKIWSGNFLRVWREVRKLSAERP